MPSRVLIALVALGAVIGSSARYGISLLLPWEDMTHLPYATLAANLSGAFIMGIMASSAWVMQSEQRRTLLVTGLMGGFTTFSAFAVETVQLVQHPALALSYVAITLLGAVGATHMGTLVRRRT